MKRYEPMCGKENKKVDFVDLRDIEEVRFDKTLPYPIRKKEYLRQIKNPYIFKCGDIRVRLKFSGGGRALEEAFFEYLSAERTEACSLKKEGE